MKNGEFILCQSGLFSLENKRLGQDVKVYTYMMETCTKNAKEMFKLKQHYQYYSAAQAGQK